LYATVELLFGAIAAVFAANQFSEGMIVGAVAPSPCAAGVFAELAALYVIVRAYDNYYKSLNGDVKDKWEQFFFK